MTVAVAVPLAAYLTDGSSTRFATVDAANRTWPFFAGSDLVVSLVDALGVETIVSPTAYSVEGAGAPTGGTVVFGASPVAGLMLRIRRRTPIAQPTVYNANDDFPAKSHERALDRAALIAQETAYEQAEFTQRALLVPVGETGALLPAAAQRAGTFLGFDADGNPAPMLLGPEYFTSEAVAGLMAVIVAKADKMATVPSIAQLRLVDLSGVEASELISVLGSAAAFDGSGSLYVFSATSLAADDGETVIKPASLTSAQAGRWVAAYGQAAVALRTRLLSAAGSAMVSHKGPGTGAGARTLYARAREDMRVTDFYEGVADNLHPFGRRAFVNTFDDALYLQKALNACADLNETRLRMPQSLYNLKTPVQIKNAIQLQGDGGIEFGTYPGTNATSFGEPIDGTVLKVNNLGYYAISFAGGGRNRGSCFDRLTFVQDHPAPAPGWAPTNYDYAFDIGSIGGQVDFKHVRFMGINKGIRCSMAGRFKIGRIESQIFTELLRLDLAIDASSIDFIHDWPYWSGAQSVMDYMQANKKLLRLGRMDGFNIQHLVSLGGKTTMVLEDFGNGVPTDLHCDYLYSDFTACAVEVTAANVRATFNKVKCQGEQSGSGGLPIPGSSAIWAKGGGGILSIGNLATERFSNSGVRMTAGDTVNIGAWNAAYFPVGAEPLWSNPSGNLFLRSREITDGTPSGGTEAQIIRGMNNRDSGLPGPFSDDAGAAGGGVNVGQSYRRVDGALVWRVS